MFLTYPTKKDDTAHNLTVIILTKNEEKNIVDVIANAKQVTDKILIIDSGSTDKTVELAEANGAKVIYRAWDNDFAAQRNFALEHVETEWVLYLDADERMNEELVSCVKKEMQSPKSAMYRFVRRNSAFGIEFKYGVLAPDSVLRMFPKDKAKWEGKVHENPVGDFPVKTLQGFLKHYTYVDFNQYLNKMNTYAAIGDNWEGNFYYLKEYCEVAYLPRTLEISTSQIKNDSKL